MKEKNIEKKEEVKNEKQEIKRPWQGTILALLQGGFLVKIGFQILLMILGGATGATFYLVTGRLKESVFLFILILFLCIILTIFLVLITGYIKGWKWTIIIAIILYSLGVIMNVTNIEMANNFPRGILIGFMLYLAIICLKHPFYNQKKVEQKS